MELSTNVQKKKKAIAEKSIEKSIKGENSESDNENEEFEDENEEIDDCDMEQELKNVDPKLRKKMKKCNECGGWEIKYNFFKCYNCAQFKCIQCAKTNDSQTKMKFTSFICKSCLGTGKKYRLKYFESLGFRENPYYYEESFLKRKKYRKRQTKKTDCEDESEQAKSQEPEQDNKVKEKIPPEVVPKSPSACTEKEEEEEAEEKEEELAVTLPLITCHHCNKQGKLKNLTCVTPSCSKSFCYKCLKNYYSCHKKTKLFGYKVFPNDYYVNLRSAFDKKNWKCFVCKSICKCKLCRNCRTNVQVKPRKKKEKKAKEIDFEEKSFIMIDDHVIYEEEVDEKEQEEIEAQETKKYAKDKEKDITLTLSTMAGHNNADVKKESEVKNSLTKTKNPNPSPALNSPIPSQSLSKRSQRNVKLEVKSEEKVKQKQKPQEKKKELSNQKTKEMEEIAAKGKSKDIKAKETNKNETINSKDNYKEKEKTKEKEKESTTPNKEQELVKGKVTVKEKAKEAEVVRKEKEEEVKTNEEDKEKNKKISKESEKEKEVAPTLKRNVFEINKSHENERIKITPFANSEYLNQVLMTVEMTPKLNFPENLIVKKPCAMCKQQNFKQGDILKFPDMARFIIYLKHIHIPKDPQYNSDLLLCQEESERVFYIDNVNFLDSLRGYYYHQKGTFIDFFQGSDKFLCKRCLNFHLKIKDGLSYLLYTLGLREEHFRRFPQGGQETQQSHLNKVQTRSFYQHPMKVFNNSFGNVPMKPQQMSSINFGTSNYRPNTSNLNCYNLPSNLNMSFINSFNQVFKRNSNHMNTIKPVLNLKDNHSGNGHGHGHTPNSNTVESINPQLFNVLSKENTELSRKIMNYIQKANVCTLDAAEKKEAHDLIETFKSLHFNSLVKIENNMTLQQPSSEKIPEKCEIINQVLERKVCSNETECNAKTPPVHNDLEVNDDLEAKQCEVSQVKMIEICKTNGQEDKVEAGEQLQKTETENKEKVFEPPNGYKQDQEANTSLANTEVVPKAPNNCISTNTINFLNDTSDVKGLNTKPREVKSPIFQVRTKEQIESQKLKPKSYPKAIVAGLLRKPLIFKKYRGERRLFSIRKNPLSSQTQNRSRKNKDMFVSLKVPQTFTAATENKQIEKKEVTKDVEIVNENNNSIFSYFNQRFLQTSPTNPTTNLTNQANKLDENSANYNFSCLQKFSMDLMYKNIDGMIKKLTDFHCNKILDDQLNSLNIQLNSTSFPDLNAISHLATEMIETSETVPREIHSDLFRKITDLNLYVKSFESSFDNITKIYSVIKKERDLSIAQKFQKFQGVNMMLETSSTCDSSNKKNKENDLNNFNDKPKPNVN